MSFNALSICLYITYLMPINVNMRLDITKCIYSCCKDLDSKFIENTARRISKSKQIENALMQSFVPVSKE